MSQKPDCWEKFDLVVPLWPYLLLWGPPGTGKSFQAALAHLEPGQEACVITLTDETPGAELRGHYVPSGDEFVWRDGHAIRAWRSGTRLVLNEIDRAGIDAMVLLHAVLDDLEVARLTLPTGETVRPAPGYSVIATMNGKPSDLPAALRDRFPVVLEIDRVHPGALACLPPSLRDVAVKTVVAAGDRAISVRAWIAFARLSETLGEELAAEIVFGKRAGDVLDALKIARSRR
jgi:hypothetical protein